MKPRNRILLIIICAVVLASAGMALLSIASSINSGLAYRQGIVPLPTVLPAHKVEVLNGLKVRWQLLTTIIDSEENGSHLQTSNGKVFFQGSIENEPKFRIVGLNQDDGSVYIKTDPLMGGTEFVVDENAFYIAENISKIYKFDLTSHQILWSQELDNIHSPCCLSYINGEIQSWWYPDRFYILSAEDGKIIHEVKDTQDYMYRIEEGVSYRRGGGTFLLAVNEDGTTRWEVELDEYIQAPVFTSDAIYVRTGRGRVYAVDRATGKIRWKTSTDTMIISNIAASDNRVYYFTCDGELLGVDAKTGEIETSAEFSPQDFYPLTPERFGFEVTYDGETNMVFIILGNSAQMIAFEE